MGRKRNFTDEQLEAAKAQILKEVRKTSPHYRRLGTGSTLPSEEMGAWRAAIRELTKAGKIVKSTKLRGRWRVSIAGDVDVEKPETPEKLVGEDNGDVKELLDDAIALLTNAREEVTMSFRNSDVMSAIMQTRNATGLMEKIVGKKNEDV